MALATLSGLFTPDVWIAGLREKLATGVSVLNSGIMQKSATFDAIASGSGIAATIPFWKDISDDADEIQVENTAPVTTNGITAGTMKATVLNRVIKYGGTALSAQVSGTDPVGEILSQLAIGRLKRRQTTLLAILRGIMGTYDQTPDEAEGCLRTMRIDVFKEDGASAGAGELFSKDNFIDGKALLGEILADEIAGGAMLIHPTVLAGLEKADAESFKSGVESGLPFRITTYRGVPLFVSNSLVRAGATSGNVYETYLIAAGALAYGEKPQVADMGDTVDMAALQYFADKDKNNSYVYDRNRFLIHPNGVSFTGSPADSSATNTELATAGNWTMKVQTANRAGIVAIRSNG